MIGVLNIASRSPDPLTPYLKVRTVWVLIHLPLRPTYLLSSERTPEQYASRPLTQLNESS